MNVLVCLNSIRRGGVEMSAIGFAENMNNGNRSFTYYIHDGKNADEELREKLLAENAKIVYKPEHIKSKLQEYAWLKKHMREKHYEVVHSHLQYHSGLVMAAAYASGVKKRISHSHFTQNNRKIGISGRIYRKLMRVCLNRFATDKLACSAEAGKFLYGKSFEKNGTVINNGINISLYKYSERTRYEERSKLNIPEEAFVIGHVGSVYYIKNQTFLVKVFEEIKKINENAILLICGEIQDSGEAQRLAKSIGLEQRVRFLGVRSDIPELLAAYDVLIFPSLFEALPIVPIEAQATGLPCLLSDKITQAIKQNENVEFMPLEASAEEWAKKAIDLANCDRESVSTEKLKEKYDIKNIAKQLEKIYES